MEDQVTSIEQSRRLLELGVPAEKASMCWVKDPNENEYSLCIHDEYCYEVAALEPVPAFTVGDLLDKVLPNVIQDAHNTYELTLQVVVGGGWRFYYSPVLTELEIGVIGEEIADNLIELLCDRIGWLVSNGYKLEG